MNHPLLLASFSLAGRTPESLTASLDASNGRRLRPEVYASDSGETDSSTADVIQVESGSGGGGRCEFECVN